MRGSVFLFDVTLHKFGGAWGVSGLIILRVGDRGFVETRSRICGQEILECRH